MGVDSWTRTAAEQRYQAREGASKGSPRSAVEKAKDRLAGHKSCACGCGKRGTVFRDRKMYDSACAKAQDRMGGPKDRTPPLARSQKHGRWDR
jgi:hypothetical protein